MYYCKLQFHYDFCFSITLHVQDLIIKTYVYKISIAQCISLLIYNVYTSCIQDNILILKMLFKLFVCFFSDINKTTYGGKCNRNILKFFFYFYFSANYQSVGINHKWHDGKLLSLSQYTCHAKNIRNASPIYNYTFRFLSCLKLCSLPSMARANGLPSLTSHVIFVKEIKDIKKHCFKLNFAMNRQVHIK